MTGRRTWPKIHLGAGEHVVGRSSGCHTVMVHASISRTHAKLIVADDQCTLEDLNSRFGTFVNGVRIVRAILKDGDMVRFGGGPPYRFNGIDLTPQVEAEGISLSIHALGVQRDDRWLIEGITLEIPSGGFVGILGPSGAGKSLLLGCLSGTIVPSKGDIEYDQQQPIRENLDYYQSKIGIVTQDDLVHGYLTARENLRLAARLRMQGSTVSEIDTAVGQALEKMGLSDHADKLIEKLSGGQRKRASIAVELLLRPRLLLLDEPTSGLDPGTQARLMDALRGLARQGITVVCSTHNTETIHYFDSVVVLGRKEHAAGCVYYGAPDQIQERFGVRNMADLFDNLQTCNLGALAKGREEAAATNSVIESHSLGKRISNTVLIPQLPRQQANTFISQLQVCFVRSALGLLRDRGAALLAAIQPVGLALLVVLTQFNHQRSTFIHFFLVVSVLWLGMTLTVRELVRERRHYVRDRLAGMVPSAYLLGKLAFAATVVSLQATLLLGTEKILACWFIPGAHEEAIAALTTNTPFLLALIVLSLAGLGGATIGLIISTMSTSERAAVAFLPILLLPQALVSRVSYGEGANGWISTSPTPVGLIKTIPSDLGDNQLTRQDRIFMVASLPMISRPSTAAIDLLAYMKEPTAAGRKLGSDEVLAEWVYLALLLMLHLLALFVVFSWREPTWTLDAR